MQIPLEMRRGLGQCARLTRAARLQIMKATIYERPPWRPFTYRLLDSEFIEWHGNAVIIGNRASYAQTRHDMVGISKMYGHDLESHWATKAIIATHEERLLILQAAQSRSMDVER